VGYSYRRGAKVIFTRDDGHPGPGESRTYGANEGWKVEIQDEGCVEISNYGAKNPEPSRVVPWHRIWEISSI
jgi:hypothetical protein